MADYLGRATNFAGNAKENLLSGVRNGSWVSIAIAIILGFIALYVIYFYGIRLIRSYKAYSKGSPYVVDQTKDARKRLVVLQDPNKPGSINLPRSSNEKGGIEMTYSCWMFIDDYNYKLGQWKHVFHKGNETSWPNRAPGVWLHPDKNAMRVYMNTYNEISDHVDIENIPVNKWFCLIIIVKGENLDVFVNGNLKNSLKLSGIPKQNYGDLYINAFGGYSGYLSRLRYYDYALNYSEIDGVLKLGPSMMPCADTGERPPYLTQNWWTNN